MAYYQGAFRQRGGGLGSLISSLARYVIPTIGRTAGAIIRRQGPKLAKAGLGVMSDIASKRNLKQTLKNRGTRLVSEIIKDATSRNSSHLKVRKGAGRVKKKRALPRKNKKIRKRDIFG